MSGSALSTSRALWNRERLVLESDEVLAQIIDRGDLTDWRELYALACGRGPEARRLRTRVVDVCSAIPVALPHLFLAAMSFQGERLVPYPRVPQPDDRGA